MQFRKPHYRCHRQLRKFVKGVANTNILKYSFISKIRLDYSRLQNAEEYFFKGKWTDAAIAVQNSGSIRASITRTLNDKVYMSIIIV